MGYQGQPSRKTQVNVGRTTLKLDEGDDDEPVFTTLPTEPVGKLLEVLQHGTAWSAVTVETMLGDGLDGYISDDDLIVLVPLPKRHFRRRPGRRERWRSSVHATTQRGNRRCTKR